MAELSVDFTNDQSRYEMVLFQRGKDVLDGELNEIGRLCRVPRYRLGVLRENNTGAAVSRAGYPVVSGLQITGTGSGEVTLQPISGQRALIAFRGYVIELTGTVVLSGMTDPTPAGGETYQVYMTLTETEISAAADPTIKVDALGETARRIRVTAAFALSAANTDSAGAANTAAEPWEGGVKACILAEVRLPATTTGNPPAATIFPKWQLPADFKEFVARNIIMTHGSDSAVVPKFVWDSSASELTVENVALVVPGNMAEGGATVQRAEMNFTGGTVISLPNEGDALVVEIMRPRDQAESALSSTIDYALSPSESQLQAYVESYTNYVEGVVDPANDDGFFDRFVIAVRGNNNDLYLRDGTLTEGLTISGETRSNMLHVGQPAFDRDLPRHARAEVTTPTQESDETPFLRSRISPRSTHYKLLASFPMGGGSGTAPSHLMRLYQTAETTGSGLYVMDGLAITVNARWDVTAGPQWVADDSSGSIPATIHRFQAQQTSGFGSIGGFISMSAHDTSVASNWGDSAWNLSASDAVRIRHDGNIHLPGLAASIMDGLNYAQLTDIADPYTLAASTVKNALYALNVPKAFGRVQSDGAGGASIGSAGGIFGCSAVAIVGTAIQVTLDNSFVSPDDMFIQVTNWSGLATAGIVPKANGTAANQFRIFADDAAGSSVSLATNAHGFYFTVYGRAA